jgi:hypothetical protein
MLLFLSWGLLALPVAGQKGRAVSTPVTLDYALPATAFRVEVTIECLEFVPGPFHAHAARQLGVAAAGERRQSWRVKAIRVTPVAVPDERHRYTLELPGDHGALQLALSPEGFLAGAGGAVPAMTPAPDREMLYTAPAARAGEATIEYARFGVESTLEEVLDSNFTMLEVEGEQRRVWDPIERHVLKEAAGLVPEVTAGIFAIRRKRLDALTSPGGITGESIAALAALEEAYLSLFLGKTVAREETRLFTYTPVKAGEATTLFRLSESRGVTGREEVAAVPYRVEVTNAVVAPAPAVEASPGRPGLTYLVPAMADLRVYRGESLLLEERHVVPQLGHARQFPLDVIGSGVSIEFYPCHGSIKSVTRH